MNILNIPQKVINKLSFDLDLINEFTEKNIISNNLELTDLEEELKILRTDPILKFSNKFINKNQIDIVEKFIEKYDLAYFLTSINNLVYIIIIDKKPIEIL